MSKNLLLIAALILCGFSTSLAQKDVKVKKQDTMSVQAKEISVIGLRYEEELKEVPLAITKITHSQLAETRGLGIDEAVVSVPGVIVQTRSGNSDVRFLIRGFGARGAGDRSNAGTTRGIKILLDGIPQTEPDGRTAFDNVDPLSIEGIEIIRSNASSIWGNAAGGVVNISTVPNNSTPRLELTNIMGSFGYRKHFLNASTNLSDNSHLYVNLSSAAFDGWRENSEFERNSFQLGLQSQIGAKTKLGLQVLATHNKYEIPGPLTQSQFDSLPEQPNATYASRNEHRNNRLATFGLTLDHNFDPTSAINFMAFVNPKYLQRSERNTYRDFNRYHLGTSLSYHKTFLIGDEMLNTVLVGLDDAYQDGAILFYNLSSTQGRDSILSQNKKEGANTFGIFLQDELRINAEWSVIAGLRYDEVTYYSQNFMLKNAKDEKKFDRIAPKFGLNWKFDPNQSLYLSYGSGIEVPAGNETDPFATDKSGKAINPLLEPIISNTFEIGNKSTMMFDDSFVEMLDYNLAAYLISITNDITQYDGGRYYATAGESQRIGLELGFNVETSMDLRFSGSFTYMMAKYIDFKLDSSLLNTASEGFTVYNDNEVSGVPKMFYNLKLRYAPEFFHGWYIDVLLNGIGDYYVDDANTVMSKSYNVINLGLGMVDSYELFSGISAKIYANFNNLADEKYTASSFVNPGIDSKSKQAMYIEPGLPFNFNVGLKLSWN